MEEDRLRFICKRTVVSTRSMEPGRLYRFSVLDHVMEPNHIRLVYYYRSSKTREPGEITKKLRESLAYALNCYPIVTGRLVKEIDGTEEKEDVSGRWKVKSNDAGMRMVEARATGSVEEWLRDVNREEELKLVHWEDMYHLHYYWSTFCVQVTEFESGGLAIGLSCSHLLADPVCAMMFIRAWADLTLSRSMMAPPLFHPLPPRRFANHRLISNNQLVIHYIKSCSLTASPSNVTEGHMVTVTFLFPDPLVRAGENEPRISTFEILAGLFWVPYSKPVKTKDTLLIHAVQEIENITKKLDYDTVMDLIEWLSSSNNGAISNGSDLVCTNLENMSYSRPMMFEEDLVLSHVSCYVEGPVAGGGQVIVLPSPPGKGPMSRVVMVSLPEREMVKVVEDELLLSFSPVVIMENTEQI
ncbi:Transferase [Arabidopsis suecica]|uniref:Transferase n=1 Tax=Arabidopsis suecica TaxID=45249 RepID=A0A8T1YI74_ARASU|nr:Transferase [Arabidopsis suecica]